MRPPAVQTSTEQFSWGARSAMKAAIEASSCTATPADLQDSPDAPPPTPKPPPPTLASAEAEWPPVAALPSNAAGILGCRSPDPVDPSSPDPCSSAGAVAEGSTRAVKQMWMFRFAASCEGAVVIDIGSTRAESGHPRPLDPDADPDPLPRPYLGFPFWKQGNVADIGPSHYPEPQSSLQGFSPPGSCAAAAWG